ncbi:MAG: DUF4173 domain-containing protein, partial [Rubrobacteridae bacterium]|nr:DUF4173 domain-containing protein [Rubrobacteridae bacterium]
SSTILTTLNTIIVFFTYSLLIIRLAGEDLRRFELFNYLYLPLELVLKSFKRSSFIINDLSSGRSELLKYPLFRQITRGSLYALPLMLLFLWLFASADLVFEKYIFTAVDLFSSFDFVGHIPLIAIVSLIIAGLMVYLITPGYSPSGIMKDERKVLIIARILSFSKPVVFALLLAFSIVSPVILIIGFGLLNFLGFDLAEPITSAILIALPASLILGYFYILYRYRLNDQAVYEELYASEQTTNPANKDFAPSKQTTFGIDKMDSVITCNLRLFTWIEASIILGSICLVSLAFVYLQFAYLFNGSASISAQGFTYAEYAHRGFFELLIASLFSFIILCFASTRT